MGNSNMKKGIVILIAILLFLMIASSCGSTNPTAATIQTTLQETTTAAASDDEEKVFDKEELAKFNGQDGQPAYVAVDGVVYDVTNYPLWKNGQHNGNSAGLDLTGAISKSPHGTAIFDKKGVPIVGKYQE